MAQVVGVRFRAEGKMYFYEAAGFELKMGENVVVNTPRGDDLAEVVMTPREMDKDCLSAELKPVLRTATDQDLNHSAENRAKEKEAYTICQRKIAEHDLDMKLVSVEYLFDNSKIMFYFTANGRVDFRGLVKDLAAIFRTRIELRQIGVRDEAKMIGGLGPCGRQICCGAFLQEFIPVSIRMAKEQNLSLNPTKISGVCGRLMCCLKYEEDHYEQTRKRMPRIGREVITPEGVGTVSELNLVKETVKVRLAKGDSFEVQEFSLDVIRKPGNTPEEPELPEDKETEDTDFPESDEERPVRKKTNTDETIVIHAEHSEEDLAEQYEDDGPNLKPIRKERPMRSKPPKKPKSPQKPLKNSRTEEENVQESHKDQKHAFSAEHGEEAITPEHKSTPRQDRRDGTSFKTPPQRPNVTRDNAVPQEQTEHGQQDKDRLGKPVRRENRSRNVTPPQKTARPASPRPAVPQNPVQNTQTSQPRKNNWQDALNKAMKEADQVQH